MHLAPSALTEAIGLLNFGRSARCQTHWPTRPPQLVWRCMSAERVVANTLRLAQADLDAAKLLHAGKNRYAISHLRASGRESHQARSHVGGRSRQHQALATTAQPRFARIPSFLRLPVHDQGCDAANASPCTARRSHTRSGPGSSAAFAAELPFRSRCMGRTVLNGRVCGADPSPLARRARCLRR
jgi:hypothetical protein